MKTKTPEPDLPPGVLDSDLIGSRMSPGCRSVEFIRTLPQEVQYGGLRFMKTVRLGWIVCTLPIGKDRTYGISVERKSVCRAGGGPHVLACVTVRLTEKNIKRLQSYLDLYKEGMIDAGSTRDRISSRRAEGQVRRARGENSWQWDS